MIYKEVTKTSYEKSVQRFTDCVEELASLESIHKFVCLLPRKGSVLDMGCGSGRDAKIFTKQGLSVTGIDFCENLLKIAKANAPLAKFELADMEEVNFSNATFDGVWACSSLSHISKKDLPTILNHIYAFLKPNGYFYLTVKKGKGEEMQEDDQFGKRFWSFFEEDELKAYLQSAKFNVLECQTVQRKLPYETPLYVRIFCQKREHS
jgi:ubiquinone/menaquinone biosynthesis C-methylase UbiE